MIEQCSNMFVLLIFLLTCTNGDAQNTTNSENGKTHTNNWAVLVDTSRFWFNYRHVANVLSMYRSVKRLGIPDRGAQFSSEIFKAVCENLGSNHRYTTAQCPQSNGLIENFHKTLLSTFRTMLTEISSTSWLELLPFSLICLRTAPFDNFGISPTLLMYGQNIRIPGALIEPPNNYWPLEHPTYEEKLQTLFSMPLSPKFKSRNSKVYVPKALDNCKYILIKDAQYGKSKLAPAYHGPYSVVRTLGNNIYYWNRNRIDCVNKINVKPYFKIEDLGNNNNNNNNIRYYQIILMVADDMACNPRNPRPATVFNNAHQHINVYGEDVEVDYRGYEVTVENFVRLLTGRLPPSIPRSKRLLTDDGSNILIYMTGHGGDGFLKFQDSEEITNVELADAFQQMRQKRRYNEILFIIDTCQAASMYEYFYSPNILAIASSRVGEDSLSHHVDPAIGVYIIDRFTYYALEFLEKVYPDSKKTLEQFLQVCPRRVCISNVGVRKDLYHRNPSNVLITEFFGSVRSVEITEDLNSVQIIPLPKKFS
ncbi:putative GPI-anchor transamidase [Armadillidium nasatum]|uniref:Putative GPI-anchor transamidase n=1 Tax=Armadillidium nasatum TaxID=96803 RepID=A0A5N5TJZ4_9CRUS|nr:putative GPI-anchor transamidase [Armadillidium nasatum]